MAPDTLKRWRLSLLWEGRGACPQREAARRLGVSFRTYQRWEAEGAPEGYQMLVGLACSAELHQLPPYR